MESNKTLIDAYVKYLSEEKNANTVFMLKNKTEDSSMVKVTEQGNPTGQRMQYPNSYSLPGEYMTYDPIKKTNRLVRYVLGELSIYKDEQAKDTDIPVKVQRIELIRGSISVRPEETNLLKCLKLFPGNESNPFRDKAKRIELFEYKPEAGVEIMMENDKVLAEAKNWCHTADFDELVLQATVLGVDTNQSPKEIRWHLMKKFAEKDPVKFLAGLNDKTNQRRYTIIEAIKHKILSVSPESNTISWTNNGQPVCMAPVGVDVITHLVNQTFTAERGEELFVLIKNSLSREVVGAPKTTDEKFKIQMPEDSEMNLIKEAIESGVIIDKISWLLYKPGTADEIKWNGKKALVKELSVDSELRTKLTNEVAQAKIPI